MRTAGTFLKTYFRRHSNTHEECLIVSNHVCMCLVLFVVSKILDSSELLCLLEMLVEYYSIEASF